MASPNAGLAFVQGFRGAQDDVRTRKRQDEQDALQKSELQHAQQRRAITEGRQDTAYNQSQQDRADQQISLREADAAKRKSMLAQAETEGVRMLADSLDAGVDPTAIEQRFNAQGEWKIAPGTLKYDKATKQVSFTGASGQTLPPMTTDQLRTIFNAQSAAEKPVVVSKDARLATPGGKVLLDAQAEAPKFEQEDPTKDVVQYVNGKRTVIRKGVPKPEDAGGRKVSPFNPEGHAKEAVDIANTAFKTKWNAETGSYVLDNPDDSERQAFAAKLITNWMSQQGADAANFGAGEVGELGFRASKARMTNAEAGAAAKKAGYQIGSPGYDKAVAKLIRDSDVKAAQIWNEGIQSIQAEREAEQQAEQEEGGRPPLSSFQK